jgi:hypothetical protein
MPNRFPKDESVRDNALNMAKQRAMEKPHHKSKQEKHNVTGHAPPSVHMNSIAQQESHRDHIDHWVQQTERNYISNMHKAVSDVNKIMDIAGNVVEMDGGARRGLDNMSEDTYIEMLRYLPYEDLRNLEKTETDKTRRDLIREEMNRRPEEKSPAVNTSVHNQKPKRKRDDDDDEDTNRQQESATKRKLIFS